MTDLELAMKLAELRSRAAARCGLRKYPGELIRLSERLERGVREPALTAAVRRKAELADQLDYMEES